MCLIPFRRNTEEHTGLNCSAPDSQDARVILSLTSNLRQHFLWYKDRASFKAGLKYSKANILFK